MSKKGYLEHTCHPSKYIAVLSEKKYFQAVFITVSTVQSPKEGGGELFPRPCRTSTIQTAEYNDMDSEWELIF